MTKGFRDASPEALGLPLRFKEKKMAIRNWKDALPMRDRLSEKGNIVLTTKKKKDYD